jgi:hypothetical protein
MEMVETGKVTRIRSRGPLGHLRPATRAWVAAVKAEWTLDEHHERLLQLAAEAWDRAEQARKAIDTFGLTYEDRFGAPRTRPEVAVERDARLGFAKLLKDLDLDAPAPLSPVALRPRRGGGH